MGNQVIKHIGFISAFCFAIIMAGCAPQAQTTQASRKPSPPPPAPKVTTSAHELLRLTHDRAPEFMPRVSPDGSQLLFQKFDMSKKNASGWSVMLMQTGSPGCKAVAGPYAVQPTWYPDGKGFIYLHFIIDPPMMVRTVIGAKEMTLVSDEHLGFRVDAPDVSPDGKRIAYHMSEMFDNRPLVCCVGTDRKNVSAYTEGMAPRWHTKDQKLAFYRVESGKNQCFVLDFTEKLEIQLTHGDSNNGYPVWSPDGNWLAFMSDRDGILHLYAMRADGSEVTQLTMGGSQEAFPEWAGDNTIYFTTDAGAPVAQPDDPFKWQYADIWKLKPILPQ